MLESLSTNILSSQLRTAISDGISSYYQREMNTLAYSEQSVESNNEPAKEKVNEVVESLNTFLDPTQTAIHFEYHEELNEYYVKVVDDVTDETIREIPPKKLLDFYAAMTEFVGIMVDEKNIGG
ncbi:flagellar protein FlaG [Peribacillus simplex]|uniref:flagellar protein FlaG n=1 Tax=Peribacillus simplex TaxID=1478 RepID=UPI0024E2683C|nr:flagellar protein FlaG [Peribacillus simplex]MDF9758889.1 flagellar protein FlaG [Peribacillus simplex]